jgi:hypothetical protein
VADKEAGQADISARFAPTKHPRRILALRVI